ncbi:MAG: complement resistance protein TraT [Gammaproteobacteria bacterium]
MLNFKNTIRMLLVSTIVIYLSGCSALHTSISKRNLDVQAKTSTAIFIDAVEREHRTVYLSIHSGVMEFDRRAFKKFVKSAFASNDEGYRVVDSPKKAQFQLNIYVLNLEKASPSAAELALKQGYIGGGGTGAGVVGGAVIGGVATGTGTGAAVGGVVGGIGTTIADAFVQDVTYMLVADVQIKEKARKGVIIRKDSQVSAKVSDAGTSTQRYSEVTTRKEYRTRIVTTANKANLELEEAQELMFKKTAYAMTGFF